MTTTSETGEAERKPMARVMGRGARPRVFYDKGASEPVPFDMMVSGEGGRWARGRGRGVDS